MSIKALQRVHIAGPYGAGKSTLAQKLSNLLSIKVYELDELKYD
jgi:adenylate kinase family enzyme